MPTRKADAHTRACPESHRFGRLRGLLCSTWQGSSSQVGPILPSKGSGDNSTIGSNRDSGCLAGTPVPGVPPSHIVSLPDLDVPLTSHLSVGSDAGPDVGLLQHR